MILPKNNCFQNIKIKLNSTTWMILMSSLVIFKALEPLQPQWPLQPQQPPWPQWPIQPHFIKKWLIMMAGSFLAPQWPILVPYCGMDIRKSPFSLISGTFSVGGCWGHPMLFFSNLVDETQMSKPPKATRHHQENYQHFYPSEPFRILRFQMRHPVFILQCFDFVFEILEVLFFP